MILSKDTIKKVNIDHLIKGKLNNKRAGEVLFIVPTNRKVRSMTNDLLLYRPGKANEQLNIETIESLCEKMLRGIAQYKNLNESTATVMLKQCIDEIKPGYFMEYSSGIPMGTIKRLYDTFTEYKRQGITITELNEKTQNLTNDEAAKAADISLVYSEFLRRCREMRFFQAGDKYAEVNGLDNRTFGTQFNSAFGKVDLIIVYGFDQFSVPEISIINQLSDIRGISLYIILDYHKHNPQVFEHLEPVYRLLLNSGFRVIRDEYAPGELEFQSQLRKRLFSTSSGTKIPEFAGRIRVIESFSVESGMEIIAKEIKRLISEENVVPKDICVAFNLVEKFTPYVRDIFRTYGIPSNITDRQKLENSQVVASLINFVEIKEGDFYYKNVIRALSQGLITVGNFNQSGYNRIISELKITSGYKTLTGAIKEKLELNNARTDGAEDNKGKIPKRKEQLALEEILQALDHIHNLLSDFTLFMTPEGFLEALKRLIVKLDIPGNLLTTKFPEIQEEGMQALSLLLETAEDMVPIAKSDLKKSKTARAQKQRKVETEIDRDLAGADIITEYPLKYYMDKLREAAANARFSVHEKPGYGVLVTALEEIRGLEFDYLFIAGMNDGVLPTRYSPQIFVQNSFQRNELQHQAYERYRFYQSLCTWKKVLYLSTALYDAGNELPVSGFLEDFVSVFEVSHMDESSLKNYIYSVEEYQRYLPVSDAEQPEWSYSPRALKVLNDMKFQSYSVTQLEQYAACPFEYMISRLLQAEIQKEPDEEAGRFEIGALLHRILFEFFTELRRLNISLTDAGRAAFGRAERILFAIAEKYIGQFRILPAMSFYEFEKITGVKGKRKNSILYRFLMNEKKAGRLFIPAYFEVSFGNPGDEPADEFLSDWEPVNMGSVNIRGKIDRIELDEQEQMFNVVDYKTGIRRPQLRDVQRGLSLQLPVYLHAAEVLLNRMTGLKYDPAGALIYSLRFSRRDFGRFNLSGRQQIDAAGETEVSFCREITAQAAKYINEYVDQISSGNFQLSALKDREETACRNCSYNRICRITDK